MQAIKNNAASLGYAGRMMLGSGLASIVLGALTINYASKDDITTAALCGVISAGMGIGAAYARKRGGEYLREKMQLRMSHTSINAAYNQLLKEEDLNQRRHTGNL